MRRSCGGWGACGRKGDIPNIGPTAEIKSLHDMSVIYALIPSQDNGLIGIELGDPTQGAQQIIGAHHPAVHDKGAVSFHIDDDFADRTALFLGFSSGWHLDIEFPFLSRKTPGQHEKTKQHEQDINHRGDEKSPWLRLDARAKIHGDRLLRNGNLFPWRSEASLAGVS